MVRQISSSWSSRWHLAATPAERITQEMKAADQAGRRIKLYVHPQTGEVIDQRQRDKYDGGHAKSNQRSSADCNERRCRDDLPQPGTIQPAAGK